MIDDDNLILHIVGIFTSVQENSSIKTKPHVVNFEGYHVGKLHQQTLVRIIIVFVLVYLK